jgi:hypothetical protein
MIVVPVRFTSFGRKTISNPIHVVVQIAPMTVKMVRTGTIEPPLSWFHRILVATRFTLARHSQYCTPPSIVASSSWPTVFWICGYFQSSNRPRIKNQELSSAAIRRTEFGKGFGFCSWKLHFFESMIVLCCPSSSSLSMLLSRLLLFVESLLLTAPFKRTDTSTPWLRNNVWCNPYLDSNTLSCDKTSSTTNTSTHLGARNVYLYVRSIAGKVAGRPETVAPDKESQEDPTMTTMVVVLS